MIQRGTLTGGCDPEGDVDSEGDVEGDGVQRGMLTGG